MIWSSSGIELCLCNEKVKEEEEEEEDEGEFWKLRRFSLTPFPSIYLAEILVRGVFQWY